MRAGCLEGRACAPRARWLVGACRVVALLLVASCEPGPAPGPVATARQPALAGGTLDPLAIPQYVAPLVVPPAMPKTRTIDPKGANPIDYYEIAVRQFQQQVLPTGLPPTTVWSYGSVNHPATFNYPAFTIEARVKRPVRVRWINDLVDAAGNFRPHLLAVDQTLHWANPTGQCLDHGGGMNMAMAMDMPMTDCRGGDPTPYLGPVPLIPHVHGAHVGPESDGYPEAWFLPDAANIPAGYALTGRRYDQYLRTNATPGTAVFQYPNDQRPATLWYHDHALGMTRLNVYAGPAGFYLLRGGPDDLASGLPAPAERNPFFKRIARELPIVVQDRSFNADGSLFYPSHRAFFEGLDPSQLQIPFIPEPANDGLMSDVSPRWNPEFFGNTMVVNGRTWPHHDVLPLRYRLRLLNGCNSRFLILKLDHNQPFWQIGNEGGFLTAPVPLTELLLGPAERADVIVDFAALPPGTSVKLLNLGPDEPFGGGVPGVDFPPADPLTTGQVMEFRVVAPPLHPQAAVWARDRTLDPAKGEIVLPAYTPLGPETTTRPLSLNEEDSRTVTVTIDTEGNIRYDPSSTVPFGPTAAKLGTLDTMGMGMPMRWNDPITENPGVGDTEVWEIHNFTMDAHPIHLHLVTFEVLDRQAMPDLVPGALPRPPEPWETARKDTVIAYPGEITRIKARFDREGLYVWHCHIVEHEDNEMMRPYYVGPLPPAE